MNKKEFGPLHPGEVLLEEYLKPEGISQNALALRMRVPAQRISEIVQGNRSITADTAIRLAKVIGTTPEFWLGLQMDFDLEMAHQTHSFDNVPESTAKTLKHQFNN